MALTLNGSPRWPAAKSLQHIGEARASCTPARVRQIFAKIADAIAETAAEVRAYIKDHPSFSGIGERMLTEWDQGVALSIKTT
jgi:serine/threonine-protein kinase HipA